MTLLLIAIIIVTLLFAATVLVGAPYVPSLHREVRTAFQDLYPVSETDLVVDLGAGDGSVLIEASRFGARCHGVEVNPVLGLIAKLRLRSNATIRVANMWQTHLPKETTLVYVFSVSRDMTKLSEYMEREVQRLQTPVTLMTFGAELTSKEPIRRRKAHTLYEFIPLQAD